MGTQDGIPTTSGPSRGPAIGERSAVRFPLCQAVLVTSCNSMDKPYVHFSKRLSKVRISTYMLRKLIRSKRWAFWFSKDFVIRTVSNVYLSNTRFYQVFFS